MSTNASRDVLGADAAEEALEPGVVGQRRAGARVEDRRDEVAAVADDGDVRVRGPRELGLVAGRKAGAPIPGTALKSTIVIFVPLWSSVAGREPGAAAGEGEEPCEAS